MFTKIFNKQPSDSQEDMQKSETMVDLDPQVITHCGIPSTASRLAYDPIQQLLAVGTLDGRIKVIGGNYIEGLLISPKELPFKNLEFLQNQGFLISVSNENDVQVWDLENRCIASSLLWESNITAFAVLQETNCMCLGDECGLVAVLKYDIEERKLSQLPYSIPVHSVSEVAGIPMLNSHTIVGILPQPCSQGKRILFAYDNGVIVLWDVSNDQLLLIRGYNDYQIEDTSVGNPSNAGINELKDESLGNDGEDKEIVSLCWASLDGSMLAVGYVDGDITIWNLSGFATPKDQKRGISANDEIKLQLSTAKKRFPVIVLHWSAIGLHNNQGGQLFVYGGDEVGSAEVLTILSLEWSPRREALRSVKRVNITLEGSFADMILLQSLGVLETKEAPSLFILSSPGQLQLYDSSCMSRLISQHDKPCTSPIHYRSAVSTIEPCLTIGRLILVHGEAIVSAIAAALASVAELEGTVLSSDKSSNWPLNGGIPYHLPPLGVRDIEKLYIAGYQDGTVRIWDATYSVLSPLFILDPEVKGINIAGAKASVCALDFSSETLNIAVGSDSGMIRLYDLSKSCNQMGIHVVTQTNVEACDMEQGNGLLLSAVFVLRTSPVRTLRYTNHGTRLAAGYESGQVVMLNVNLPSVHFLVDTLPSPNFPITSLVPAMCLDAYGLIMDQSESPEQSKTAKQLIFALRSDLHVAVLDSSTGDVVCSVAQNHNKESTAVSMYIVDGTKCVNEVAGGKDMHLFPERGERTEPIPPLSDCNENISDEVDRSTNSIQSSTDMQLLVCCTNLLQMYSLTSVIQGHADIICEINLRKICCWTATFRKSEETDGLILLYQTGSIEIRSMSNLEVLSELSLMSILRWNFKPSMEKTTSCTENGQISLVNGCEFAIVSLLAREIDFRSLQSLPCLHDKTLAAALDLSSSPNQNKNKKDSPLGIFGGIVKGLRASKDSQPIDPVEGQKFIRTSLDRVFSRSPADPSMASKVADEAEELDIDDIDIDEPLHVSPLSHEGEIENKESADRKKLFEGGTSEANPKQRTVEEIKAKYRRDTFSSATNAASAASEARDKLLERKEKLERISKNSEELRNGAENFSSMAKELAKRMENRKWWQL